VRLKNDLSLAQALAPQDGIPGAVVEPNLPGKLGAGVGAIVQVGDARFRINGIIAREPDRITGILSLGPRLMIGADALTATGLVQPGSQIRYRYRVALDPGTEADAWIEALKAQFPKAGWRIRSFHEAAPGLRRFIERMTLFLTFVGLTTLLVGGIGVSNAVGNYMDAKTTTIATLKCLGCEGGLVMRIYLIQVLALAALGIALGLLVAAGVPMAGALALQGRLPVELDAGLHAWPLVLAAAFGGLTAITFSLWPLGRSGRVSAASLFRDRVDPARAAPGWTVRGWVAGGGAALIALTLGTASHLGFALWFVGGAIATMGALRGAAWGLARLAARIRTGRWTVARLALANLHRPGAATRSIVVSLGLGLAVLVAVALIEANLSRQIDERLPKRAPAFFFIDIQPHQVAGFDKVIAGLADGGDYRRVATLRGRIVAIAGVPVEKARIGAGAAWAVRGDRALTYLPRPFEGAHHGGQVVASRL
jgi:putative ABC transport system permease protein